MTIHLLDLTLPTLEENLALDEALLLDAEAGGPEVLRFWRADRHGVVLGAAGRVADDVHVDACQADAVPIGRRSSGGGTVLLGPGCLVFSLVLRFDRAEPLGDLHASYRHILDRIATALQPHAGSMVLCGSSDLTLAGRKFSGNSQQRKRTHLLHHGTLLHAFDLPRMPRYLKPPPRQPDYRRRRDHVDFVTNLPMTGDTLQSALCAAWQAEEPLASWPAEAMRRLVADKYALTEWVMRR